MHIQYIKQFSYSMYTPMAIYMSWYFISRYHGIILANQTAIILRMCKFHDNDCTHTTWYFWERVSTWKKKFEHKALVYLKSQVTLWKSGLIVA